MLFLIAMLGGLLLMMGRQTRSESLFYYFRLKDQVPENHLLRLIDRHVSFDFVHEKLRESYSETGRPSIDPEVLLRILLIGYLHGITSERKLAAELRMHLACRWFTGLGFDQEIPHHPTEVVDRCMKVGLVAGEHLLVDGSFIQANASNASRILREQLAEAARVKGTVREYLTELEQQNGNGEPPTHQQDRVSTTDPDATYASKGGRVATLGYLDNYLVDNHSCLIVDVQATAARLSQESMAARDMITRFSERQGSPPRTVAADTTYGNGEMLDCLEQHSITGHIPVKECPLGKSGLYSVEQFTYQPDKNAYICP
jgi:transposase